MSRTVVGNAAQRQTVSGDFGAKIPRFYLFLRAFAFPCPLPFSFIIRRSRDKSLPVGATCGRPKKQAHGSAVHGIIAQAMHPSPPGKRLPL
jgi:hypothetical protein